MLLLNKFIASGLMGLAVLAYAASGVALDPLPSYTPSTFTSESSKGRRIEPAPYTAMNELVPACYNLKQEGEKITLTVGMFDCKDLANAVKNGEIYYFYHVVNPERKEITVHRMEVVHCPHLLK